MGSITRVSQSEGEAERKIDYRGLQESLEGAVRKAIPENQGIGIAFSGGLDSGILAFSTKKYSPKAALLVVGVPGSTDFDRAIHLAKKWKMKILKKELKENEIVSNYETAGKILKTKDHLQQTIGVVNLAVAKLAKENGIKTVFVGSGADELFCGYASFEKCRDKPIECERLRAKKVENVEEHDVKREKKCGKYYGITLQAPYLNPEFSRRALQIPAIQNLQGKYGHLRKAALRTLGEKMRVDKEIIQAPKKAMQYGSGVAKIVKSFTGMPDSHPIPYREPEEKHLIEEYPPLYRKR